MKILDSIIQDYSGTEFDVYKDSDGISFIKFSNGDWIKNEAEYAEVLLGKCASCSSLLKDNFTGFEYDKVLVAGLGLGLIPNELSEVNKCSKIDVVEISQEVIDYHIFSGHLNPMINLIHGDIHEHITSEKYDLIIIDTAWASNGITDEKFQALFLRFSSNLNAGGAMSSPITHHWLTK